MRLFVAVRPPESVLDAIARLPRPDESAARWTTRDQWHVTLRFLGNIDTPEPVVSALDVALAGCAPVDVVLGPRARMLRRQVVYLPIEGLDAIAGLVARATASFGEPPPSRPFMGHVTLARTKGARVDVSGLGLAATWTVGEVELIRSHLGGGPARYETLRSFPLPG